jgi:hypothetical protein
VTAKQQVLRLDGGSTIRFASNTKWFVWDCANVRIGEGATPEKAWESALRYLQCRGGN